MSLLSLNNITYTYEGTKKSVLNGIQIDFDKGKLYVLMGKSGAGKSTLLSLLSGLDVPTQGEIMYMNKCLSEMNRDDYRAKEIGVIFQGYNLLTNATALENIVLSINISGTKTSNKKALAYELLQKVGIDRETADRKVLKLSGGEQQRVGIARAISHEPSIIIADEPTGNLDAETEAAIMQILATFVHEQNKCVIIVTHSKKISSYADEVWELQKGKISHVRGH